jgi:hypothetical protein
LPVAKQNFQLLVCQKFGCPPSEYEEKVFRKCLYWHARLLAPVVRRVTPDFFMEDFKFIRYLGDSTGLREINADLMNYRDANLGNPSFWRTGLKIRVSGRKASKLAQLLFVAEREAKIQAIDDAPSPSGAQRQGSNRNA